MPEFERIEYTTHAVQRMRRRKIPRKDVEHTLRYGEGRPGDAGSWIIELGQFAIVIAEEDTTARVLTVIRRKGRT